MTVDKDAAAETSVARLERLRLLSAVLVVTLLAQFLVGMANTFWVKLPDSGSGWKAAGDAGLLMAHITLGVILLVASIWIMILAIRAHDNTWVTATSIGVTGIIISLGAGFAFMGEVSDDVVSFVMAAGCSLAIGAFALALYPVRRTDS